MKKANLSNIKMQMENVGGKNLLCALSWTFYRIRDRAEFLPGIFVLIIGETVEPVQPLGSCKWNGQ